MLVELLLLFYDWKRRGEIMGRIIDIIYMATTAQKPCRYLFVQIQQ